MAQRNTKLTQEEFLERIENINPRIKILSEYINRKSNVKCQCLDCNNIWNPKADKLLQGRGCPICAIKKMKQCQPQSNEEFLKKFNKLGNKNVLLLEKYINSKTKIHCKCKICGNEWNVIPSSLLNGHGCSICGNESAKLKTRKSHEQFMKEFSEVGNKNIKIIGRYINSNSKIEVQCKECGKLWNMSAIKLLYEKQGCIDCYRKNCVGKNHPMWNPNKTEEERKTERKYEEYYIFVRKTMERDNYTCQITNQKGGDLVVHHLNGYNWDIKNRTSIDNGITLSKEIHNEFHKIYGNGNNTKEQFIDFIKFLYKNNRITKGNYDSLLKKII